MTLSQTFIQLIQLSFIFLFLRCRLFVIQVNKDYALWLAWSHGGPSDPSPAPRCCDGVLFSAQPTQRYPPTDARCPQTDLVQNANSMYI